MNKRLPDRCSVLPEILDLDKELLDGPFYTIGRAEICEVVIRSNIENGKGVQLVTDQRIELDLLCKLIILAYQPDKQLR